MANPSIAIIGLEGSGKTVLMTVLAKRIATPSDKGYYLEPIGVQTMRRVESAWTTLQQGEWPPSTPPGEMFNLYWVLHINRNAQNIDADIRLVDLAGQDIRQMFNNDDFRNAAPEHLQPLVEYISNASTVLLVLNIKDYIAETDNERRIDNQIVLKSALDQLSKSKKVMIVFTQYDQYDEYLKLNGGLDAFYQQYIPYIYSTYIATKAIPTTCVSAVNDTEVKINEAGRRVPVPNFTSRGLEELQEWLVDEICEYCNPQVPVTQIVVGPGMNTEEPLPLSPSPLPPSPLPPSPAPLPLPSPPVNGTSGIAVGGEGNTEKIKTGLLVGGAVAFGGLAWLAWKQWHKKH